MVRHRRKHEPSSPSSSEDTTPDETTSNSDTEVVSPPQRKRVSIQDDVVKPQRLIYQNTSNAVNTNMNAEGGEEDEENELALSPFYEGYEARTLVDKWRMSLPGRLQLTDWAYYIKTSRRKKDRSQVDKLVGDVCAGVLSMRELPHYSIDSGSNCFVWANSAVSRKFMQHLKVGNQIVGRVHGEALFKDKQCLANILDQYKFQEWRSFAPHVCMDENKDLVRRNAQRICKHQYIGHYMAKCIDATDTTCPNREYRFCECFRKLYFMPEFYMFPHFFTLERFIKRYETDIEFQKTTWLAKPAYLTAGKGFFLIRNPQEFRYFYQVRNDSCVRREGFVLQRYLNRPCHMAGTKVDVRMYLMISVLNGKRICGFFHPGYVRKASQLWGTKSGPGGLPSGDVFEHLTSRELFKLKNVKLPKKSDDDDDDDEEDEGGAIQCVDYNTAVETMTAGGKDSGKGKKADKENLLPFAGDDDEAEGGFTEAQFDKYHYRFKFIIEVLCQKLDPIVRHKPGTFQIFGLDIFIDADTKPWLLEVNSHVATEQIYDPDQCKVISNVVTEAICIHVELFQKSIQEEVIATEIQQRDVKLSKLTRAQRMMTARNQQQEIDDLTTVLDKTEVSIKKPPIFLQNFFWWYDTPANRWYKPWIIKKRIQRPEISWYARMFRDLIIKDEMTNKKIFKADDQTRLHDNMDYFKHIFWQEKMKKEINEFEVEKITKREQMVASRTQEENNQNSQEVLQNKMMELNARNNDDLNEYVRTEIASNVVKGKPPKYPK